MIKLDIFRKKYRELSEDEKLRLESVKSQAENLWLAFDQAATAGAGNREMALAKTKLEEAIMWATKAITG